MSTVNSEIGEATTIGSARIKSYEPIKPWLDFVLALVMLFITSPLIVLAVLLTKLNSPGSGIYCQQRLGLRGRAFTIYKIRTMYEDCECQSGPTWALPGDHRVTPVGRALRRAHIDELPQLFNVLKGDMSLVGPRPERPEFLPMLERALPNYRERLTVRPGLTGLAQVQLPPDTDLSSVRRKLSYDVCYVERMSPWLDVRLLFGTALTCLGVPFIWVGRILWLPDPSMGPACGSSAAAPQLATSTTISPSNIQS